MTDVRQRHVGVVWGRVVPALAVPVLLMAFVVPMLPPGYAWQRWLVGLPCVVWFLWGGVQPLVWWWGADLRVDDAGVHFGTTRRRARPAQVTFAARNPYDVGWSALSDVRLVRDRSAVRAMTRTARRGSGAPQPTTYLGYFPARGRSALVLDVVGVSAPPVRPPSTRRSVVPGAEPGVAMAVATTWVFPVRRVEPVLAALREHGVGVSEVDAAVDPVRRAGAGGPLPDVERFPGRLDG